MEDRRYTLERGVATRRLAYKFNKKYTYDSDLTNLIDRDMSYMNAFLLTSKECNKAREALIETDEWKKACADYGMTDDYATFLERRVELHKKYMGSSFDVLWNVYRNRIKKQFVPTLKLIQDLFEEAKSKDSVKQLNIVDGKLVPNSTYLVHNILLNSDKSSWKSRKDLGILASEWFGQTEAFYEAVGCASFYIKDDLVIPPVNKNWENFKKALFGEVMQLPEISLIIDASEPALQKLIHLDLFNYIRNKNNKEYLQSLSEVEWESLINLQSISSDSYVALENLNWAAIPGGIPPQFIKAVQLNKINHETEELQIAKDFAMFMGVPLIDENLNILEQSELCDEQEIKTLRREDA